MNVHKNARLTAHSRADLVRKVLGGQLRRVVAATFGVDPGTIGKWVRRFQAEGAAGLADRSSRPHRLRAPTPTEVHERIIALRRQRFIGQKIARETGVSPATVSRVLRRARLNRIRDLEPAEPVSRYKRDRPGDMIHLDIKKPGRFDQPGRRITGDRTGQSSTRGERGGSTYGQGWEFVHVCIDDASRIGFSQILPDEKKESAVVFLKATIGYYASLGVTVTRVMTEPTVCAATTAHATKLLPSATPARPSASDTSAQNPTRQGPTARPNASPRPLCANGPMPRNTRLRNAAPPSFPTGYTDTTGIDRHGGIKLQTPISRLAIREDNLLSIHI